MNTFQTPLFRRSASSGRDHQWAPKDEPKQHGMANGANPDGIKVDPDYVEHFIPEHCVDNRRWPIGFRGIKNNNVRGVKNE